MFETLPPTTAQQEIIRRPIAIGNPNGLNCSALEISTSDGKGGQEKLFIRTATHCFEIPNETSSPDNPKSTFEQPTVYSSDGVKLEPVPDSHLISIHDTESRNALNMEAGGGTDLSIIVPKDGLVETLKYLSTQIQSTSTLEEIRDSINTHIKNGGIVSQVINTGRYTLAERGFREGQTIPTDYPVYATTNGFMVSIRFADKANVKTQGSSGSDVVNQYGQGQSINTVVSAGTTHTNEKGVEVNDSAIVFNHSPVDRQNILTVLISTGYLGQWGIDNKAKILSEAIKDEPDEYTRDTILEYLKDVCFSFDTIITKESLQILYDKVLLKMTPEEKMQFETYQLRIKMEQQAKKTQADNPWKDLPKRQ